MDLQYIPFSSDLKKRGFKKAGWYQRKDATPDIQQVTQTSFTNGLEDDIKMRTIKLDLNLLRYYNKNGWEAIENNYYKFVCRHHGDLKYYNSFDYLIPVIQKIEKEDKTVFEIRQNGCIILKWGLNIKNLDEGRKSFDLPNWSNNVFKVIVEYLKQK